MKPSVAIGPALPEFGSWNWVGESLIDALREHFDVAVFDRYERIPECDVVVFVKFKPHIKLLRELSRRLMVVFVPIDIYGSVSEITADLPALREIDLVIVHSRRLQRYFNGMCRTEYSEHPLRYCLPQPRDRATNGTVLWVGRSCNLEPAFEFLKRSSGQHDVHVLTDAAAVTQVELRFALAGGLRVRVNAWSEACHLDALQNARVAVDIKGSDFRARHKPPAKLFDFLASGVPVVTNRGSSVDLHAQELGVHLPYPFDWEQQLTPEFYYALDRAAHLVRERCAPSTVEQRFLELFRSIVSVSCVPVN